MNNPEHAGITRALGADTSEDREWTGGEHIESYNIAPGLCPWMIMLRDHKLEFIGKTWGYRTPAEAAAKRKPWINARVEKALTGRYFRHMFREGRVIIPGGGWFEWTLEGGKKQPWYITRKVESPIFMAGLTNFRPYTEQDVEVGFVIVTEDCEGGMVDIHDRRPVVLEPEDAWRWMDPDTPLEEAAHIAQTRSLPTEAFTWWRVDRAVNRVDPNNNGRELITPINYEYD
ncbi:SOS response-associated peptidase [Nitrosospira briensis]|uniref:SOS response-associated peptidase n=1 Tax=Nitrosospira briensis TaxID=35799 RepID=UPI0009459ACA|nr:SOS response-associated peptidase family protein [Nitrosospira briensis]